MNGRDLGEAIGDEAVRSADILADCLAPTKMGWDVLQVGLDDLQRQGIDDLALEDTF